MKKGDVIERRKDLPIGTILIRQCPDEAFAEEQMLHIEKHYNFRDIPKMKTDFRPTDGLCIVLAEASYLLIQARVQWVVDQEFAIEYLDTGGMCILNSTSPEGMGWVVISESTPVYQDSVEHMTDEELRASIEELRARRVSRPTTVQRKHATSASTVSAASASPEDKALASLLSSKTPAEMLELKRKLGLC